MSYKDDEEIVGDVDVNEDDIDALVSPDDIVDEPIIDDDILIDDDLLMDGEELERRRR